MILDAAELAPGTRLEADLCIVGGGAAGITVARRFAGTRHSVIVLEGGGLEYEEEVQARYVGQAAGTLLGEKSGYLTTSRLHYFGGTTNHWHGYCRPLDPEDLEARDWLGSTGWPLDRATLDPYYEAACALAEVTPFQYDPAIVGRPQRLLAGDAAFETTFFHLSPPTRFGTRYRAELEAATNVRVILHATALRLAAEPEGRRLLAVEAARPGGAVSVVSRCYVLATGGIENARLLLASRDVARRGLGNDRDLVGRHFMDHPAVALGHVVIPYWRVLMDNYLEHFPIRVRHRLRGALRMTPEWQRRERAMNAVFLFADLPAPEQWPELAPAVAALATDVLQLAEGHPDPETGTQFFGEVELIGEQLADPANRVTLSDEVDDLGLPRVKLQWRFRESDERSLRAATDRLIRSLGAELRGRVRRLTDGDALWERTRWSNHHLGTTRMADSPERGVVDSDCRIHGIDNLYVAGSSVFPTSGCSNPTLTILALALRLGDHLAERFAT